MPTFETIKKCAECWSESRLRERAKLWPDPLTWEWFLGDRLEPYSRAQCVEILTVAIAFVVKERVRLPVTPRMIWLARSSAEKSVLLEGLAALGVILDLWELGDREPPEQELIDALKALSGERDERSSASSADERSSSADERSSAGSVAVAMNAIAAAAALVSAEDAAPPSSAESSAEDVPEID